MKNKISIEITSLKFVFLSFLLYNKKKKGIRL